MLGLGSVARFFLRNGSAVGRKRERAVAAINALESWAAALDDNAMRYETGRLRRAVADGAPLDGEVSAQAFALVREAARRVLGQRPYDVQLLGGIVLMEGRIAEMRTGEGKTLVAALPTFLSALEGKGVHVVTVNDYLARRDAQIVGRVHEFLGLTVGVVVPGMGDDQKRAAYACDVTYGTNSEIGFDYLRDNLRSDPSQMVQRGHHYAIVDEVDSILIDEARTPLIISGPAEDAGDLYQAVDAVATRLGADDMSVDEKQRAVTLTEEGTERVEVLLREAGLLGEGNLYEGQNAYLVHHVNQALKAHVLYKRDKDYISKDGEIVIVDEFTGRTMAGRRFSEGLHQALEAKEGVRVQPESHTLSSITYQNLFRMYGRLSGMTGTAQTEAEEFGDIYGLEVVTVPTHRAVARIDEDDEIHLDARSKHAAIAAAVAEAHAKGQPILIGTASIEKSETIASVLERAGFKRRTFDAPVAEVRADGGVGPFFQVLNARHHAHEALIVAQAGVPGAVTIATNMAGRGTDIQLGGSVELRVQVELGAMPEGPEREAAERAISDDVARLRAVASDAGGLLVIGTERHESRRIDNQLRGRSGRQGDPGRSRFYVSMDDDIARVFGSERMARLLPALGLSEGEAIVHPWISKALEKAQRKVESSHYDTRKNLIKYDDVTNEQRKAMFAYRKEMMTGSGIDETVDGMRADVIDAMVERRIPANSYPEQWDAEGLAADVRAHLSLDLPITDWVREEGVAEVEVRQRIVDATEALLSQVSDAIGADVVSRVRKAVLLEQFDRVWREHLSALEHLRSVVGFRSYAQRDPIVEYRTDAYNMFLETVAELSKEVTATTMRIRPAVPEAARAA